MMIMFSNNRGILYSVDGITFSEATIIDYTGRDTTTEGAKLSFNTFNRIIEQNGILTVTENRAGVLNSTDGGATWYQNKNVFDIDDRFDGHNIDNSDYTVNETYENGDRFVTSSLESGDYHIMKVSGQVKTNYSWPLYVKNVNGIIYMYGGHASNSRRGEIMYGLKYSIDGGLTWNRCDCDQTVRYIDVRQNGIGIDAIKTDGSYVTVGGIEMAGKYLDDTGAAKIVEKVIDAIGDTSDLETTATDITSAINELYDAIQEIQGE